MTKGAACEVGGQPGDEGDPASKAGRVKGVIDRVQCCSEVREDRNIC